MYHYDNISEGPVGVLHGNMSHTKTVHSNKEIKIQLYSFGVENLFIAWIFVYAFYMLNAA